MATILACGVFHKAVLDLRSLGLGGLENVACPLPAAKGQFGPQPRFGAASLANQLIPGSVADIDEHMSDAMSVSHPADSIDPRDHLRASVWAAARKVAEWRTNTPRRREEATARLIEIAASLQPLTDEIRRE